MGVGKRAAIEGVPGTNVPMPAPVPQLQVPTVPAPGQRGPKGLVGRQAYSRVNTGAPQAPDAGAYAQKSIPPAGTKKTSEVSIMTMAARPTIQDMLKMAMAGTSSAAGSAVSRIKVAEEAKRQLENLDDEGEPKSKKDKKKDEGEPKEKVSSAYVLKLASAVEYCAEILEKEGADLAGPYTLTEQQMAPGMGPNALEVSETPTMAPVNQQNTGQAIAGNQPPMNPPTQKAMPQERGAAQLQNDMDSAPGGGDPPMSGETTNYAKVARVMKIAEGENPGVFNELGRMEGQYAASMDPSVRKKILMGGGGVVGGLYGGIGGAALGSSAGPGGMVAGGLGGAALGAGLGAGLGYVGAEESEGYLRGVADEMAARKVRAAQAVMGKQASPVAYLRALKKYAEDAGSPSSIAAGPVQQNDMGPPGVLDSSEAGPPAKDKEKVPSGHDATRAFTRADAKATPKAEMKAVLDEPMMSSQTDKVLDVNLSHDGDSKISSARDVTKVAAARALLAKLRREAQN